MLRSLGKPSPHSSLKSRQLSHRGKERDESRVKVCQTASNVDIS